MVEVVMMGDGKGRYLSNLVGDVCITKTPTKLFSITRINELTSQSNLL